MKKKSRTRKMLSLLEGDMGRQSRSCYSSRRAQEQHQAGSARNRQRDMKQNIPSYPAGRRKIINNNEEINIQQYKFWTNIKKLESIDDNWLFWQA